MINKWGNSCAIRIPSQILKQLNLEEGAEIEMIVTPDRELLLRPVHQAQGSNAELHAHLQQLLSQIKPNARHEEVDLGIEGDELI